VTAGVACEPANHEFLGIDTRIPSVRVDPRTGLRDIEAMELRSPDVVRSRIDEKLVRERIAPIATPMLVMGRDGDHRRDRVPGPAPEALTQSRPGVADGRARKRRRAVVVPGYQLTAMYFDSR